MANVRLINKTALTHYLRVHRPNKAGTGPVTTALLMPRSELLLPEEQLTDDIHERVRRGQIKMVLVG